MSEYLLEIEASAVFSSEAPTLEILVDGVVVSSFLIEEQTGSGTSFLQYNLSYGGDYPDSLSFRFLDAGGEEDRSITIHDFDINGFDGTSYVGQMVLLQGQTSNFDTEGFFGGGEPAFSPPPFTEDMPDLADLDPVTIQGTAADETLSGAGGHIFDVIDGAGGNDVINGQRGDDQIWGGDGDDVIFGNEDNDTLIGADGDDNVQGGQGDDNLWGGLGNDKLSGGDGNDNLSGNEGNDKIYGNDGDDVIYGGDGHDKLYGQLGDDEIHGGAGNDKIYGNEGNNTIYGDAGNDKIFMAGGNNTAYGGADNDKILGDDGNNDVMYGEDGDDVLAGYGGNDYMYGGAGYDRMYGHEGNDRMYAGDGDDFVLAHNGNDIVEGGNGNDTISAEAGNDRLYGDAGDDNINGGAGDDRLYGGADNDVLTGAAGYDRLYGEAGDDVLHGGGLSNVEVNAILNANPNVVYSRETNSFYEFVSGPVSWGAAQTAALGSTLNGVNGHLVNITSAAENQFIYDLAQANGVDNSTGGSGNRIWLGASDTAVDQEWRWIDGIEAGIQFSSGGTATNNMYENWGGGQPNNSGGAQVYATMWFNGGANDDAWDDRNASDGHNYIIEWEAGLMADDNSRDDLYGGDGDDWVYGYGGNDRLYGDNGNDVVFGGNGDDIIRGGNDDDYLSGGDGNDNMRGDNGDDTLHGGDGDDILNGGGGTDTASYVDASAGVTVNLDTTAAQNTVAAGTDTLSGIENVIGSSYNDTLQTSGGARVLDGRAGDDTFIVDGTDGYDDTFIGGTGTDTIVNFHTADPYQAASSIYFDNETVFSSIEAINAYNQDIRLGNATTIDFTGITLTNVVQIYGSNQADNITGSAGDDTIVGNNGDDIINGGDGADDLYGEDNNDTVNGGDGDDTIRASNGSDTLNGDDGDDNFIVDGGHGYDDAFNGGAGTDTIHNFHTADPYQGSSSIYFDSETSFSSIEEINAYNQDIRLGNATTIDFSSIGTMTDVVRIWGSGSIDNITGSLDDDIIYGNNGNDVIDGDDGDDTLYGGNNNDTVSGGTGIDTLYGNNGDDTLNGGVGNDTLDGGGNNDIVNGDDGDDTLIASTGNDTLNGGNDNDSFIIDGTHGYGDAFNGGAGTDVIHNFHTADPYQGSSSIRFDSSSSFSSIEEINAYGQDIRLASTTTIDFSTISTMTAVVRILGSGQADNITGSQDDDTIEGGNGDDIINGGIGDDTLDGDNNDDTVNGGAGDDTLIASNGNDTLNGGDDNDSFIVDGSLGYGDAFNGGAGNDVIHNFHTADPYQGSSSIRFDSGTTFSGIEEINAYGQDIRLANTVTIDFSSITTMTGVVRILGSNYVDNITGSQDDDIIYGRNGDDILNGDDGADTLYGGNNNDTLNGGDGVDTLYGQNNDDILNGGLGADNLYGGNGADTFDFDSLDAVDTIYDFNEAQNDALDISDLLVGFNPGTDDINDFVQFTEVAGDTIVSIDANGTVGGASFTNLVTLDNDTGLDVDTLYTNGQIIV